MEESESPCSNLQCSNGASKLNAGRRPLSQLNAVHCIIQSSSSCHNSPMISKSRSCHSIQEEVEDENCFSQSCKVSPCLSSTSCKTTPLTKGFSGSPRVERPHSSGVQPSSHGRSTPSPLHSSKSFLTPLSSKNHRRFEGMCTSQSSCMTHSRANPFEESPEVLHLPTVSPSLFKEVVSPSQKVDESFAWSIDQMALLHPAQIDTSPYQQCSHSQDPDYERRAQEAIDRYFSSSAIVPSPWTSSTGASSHSLNIMSALLSSKSSSNFHLSSASPALLPPPQTRPIPSHESEVSPLPSQTVWCQTELTLPPVLPKEVEDVLSKFCLFTQDQTWQSSEEKDDTTNLNASSLRRKLTFDAKELSTGASTLSIPNKSRSLSGSSACSERDSQAHSPSSVASVGPLPLDDDESPKISWGSSMIRNSSMKMRHRTALPSGLYSESNSSHSNSPNGNTSHCDMICSADSPPVSHFAPKLRMIDSPSSHQRETQRISSPDISPIHHPSLPSIVPELESIKFPVIKEPLTPLSIIPRFPPSSRNRAVEKVVGNVSAFKCSCHEPCQDCCSHFDSCSSHPNKESCDVHPRLAQRDSTMVEPLQGIHLQHCNSFEMIDQRKCQASQSNDTASMKNRSPQFSSSPIRQANQCSEATRLERSPFNQGRADRTPPPLMKFSDSPPISPIAWKGAPGGHSLATFRQFNDKDESILVYQDSTREADTMEAKDCEFPRSRWVCALKEQTTLGESELQQIDVEKDVTMIGLSQRDTHLASTQVPLSITDMDTDSQPFLEGSCLEETSNAQDTGYQTGTSSLQATSHSLHL